MQKLYYNGTILTMENQFLPEALLEEDGIIIGVGNYDLLLNSSENSELIDLKGKTMLPAFIDSHSHLSSYATSFLQVSLEECSNFDNIARKIKEFITENNIRDHEWVVCRGYDNNDLSEKTHPDLNFLDNCLPNNPVVLQHSSGHVGVFNSMALKELGVTPDTIVPDGGVIESKNGVLTGYMEENAFFSYLKKVPMSSVDDMILAFSKAEHGYYSNGITTIQDGMMVEQLIPIYNILLGSDVLKLDVVAYLDIKDSKAILDAFPLSVRQYNRHFKIGGYKIFLDGSPQGRTAWMKMPYKGEDSFSGYGTMHLSDVVDAIRLAAKNNMQILAHCNGDSAAQQYIDAVKIVSEETDVSYLRPVMIHAQLLDREQLPDIKSIGIIPSFFVAHVFYWGDIHLTNFGEERASHISPTASALKNDIRFTFHQDTPVVKPDMLETIWCAVNRKMKNGNTLGVNECISVYAALKAVTINAAYQYFEEDKKGSLRVGKCADFVILDKNPLTLDPMAIRDITVLETIKNGKVLFSLSEK